jgi:hypothetical protein
MGLIGASEASAGPIKAFLDKEQRPGAQVITESFVDYDYKDETVFVQGVLGAIESERNPGSYVAFSGVELKSELFYLKDDGSSLAFELSSISNVLVLTVQMILADGELFALDLNLNNENKNDDFKISLDSFKESFRGRHGDKVFKGKFSDVASVRFFLKRSENSPEQKKPLDFSFNLKNLRFED